MLYVLTNGAGDYPEEFIESIKQRGLETIEKYDERWKENILLVRLETMEDIISLYLAVSPCSLIFDDKLGEDDLGAHYSILIYDRYIE